jgi:hypothetical protein
MYADTNNLSGGDIESGYTKYSVRIKLDDNLKNIGLAQTWGSNWFELVDLPLWQNSIFTSREIINTLKETSSILIELPVYSEGSVIYTFDTVGFNSSQCPS